MKLQQEIVLVDETVCPLNQGGDCIFRVPLGSSGDEAHHNEEGDAPPVSSNGCCREQLLEIKALRK